MTAFTTPSTWTSGTSVAAATLNAQLRDNMLHITEIGAWSPTLTQSGTVSRTLNYGRYRQQGKWVWCQCTLSVTGTGTAANGILLSLPVTASSSMPFLHVVGSGFVQDASVALYHGVVVINTTTTVGVHRDSATGLIGDTGGPSFALASTDKISVSFSYEAA